MISTRTDDRFANLQATIDRLRRERSEILNVETTDGLTASEWIARTADAEAKRDRALARIAALESQAAELTAHIQYLAAKANIEVGDRNGRAIWLEWKDGGTDGLIVALDAARKAAE